MSRTQEPTFPDNWPTEGEKELPPPLGDSDPSQRGIFYDMSFDEYEQWPGLNKSRLWTVHKKTLAHYKYELDHPERFDKDAYRIGHATHAAILQPEQFEGMYIVGGPINPATSKTYGTETKKFKEWAAEQDKPVLAQEQFDLARNLRDAVWNNKLAASLLKGARTEVSMQWVDGQTGLLLKGRMDAYNDHGVIPEIKTCRCANAGPFGWQAYDLGYTMQGCMYPEGVKACLGGELPDFVFIAIEKDPPYLVACYQMDGDAITVGQYQYHTVLQQVAGAMRTGVWHGYINEILPLEMPSKAGFELSAAQM